MNKRTDWEKIEKRICEECNNIIIHRLKEKYNEYKKRRFCSNKCKMKSLSKLFIGKKSHNNRQIMRVCKNCGRTQMVSPSFSKRPFCSRRCMAEWFSRNKKGKNHWNWQGGITEKESRNILYDGYKEWRKKVFKRDGYKCVVCGNNKSGELEAHHIKPVKTYKKLILNVSNGLTVCKRCHRKIHYGKRI